MRRLAWMFIAGIGLTSMSASADVINFLLGNHPDAGKSPPPYGLRLDGLYSMDTNDVWTFDFEHASSDMRLSLDTNNETVHIFGQAYGGLDDGNSYATNLHGLWEIDFTYSTNVSVYTNDPFLEVVVDPDAPLDNNGTLTAKFSGTGGGNGDGDGDSDDGDDDDSDDGDSDDGDGGSITVTNGDVIDFEQHMEFYFNNTDDYRLDGSGLSGPDTFVGWGWLNHSDKAHIKASDWIFTATAPVVPVPAAAWLFGSALGLVAWARRFSARSTGRPEWAGDRAAGVKLSVITHLFRY